MILNSSKKKKFIPTDPSMRNKTLYILYKFDILKEEMMSEGPFIKKDEAYEKMNGFLKKGVCSWVVAYNE